MVDAQHTPTEHSPCSTLKAAIEAARAGRRGEAKRLLHRVVAAEPDNESAWLWLAGVTDRAGEAQEALERVARLRPDHPRLDAARRWADSLSVARAAAGEQTRQPAPLFSLRSMLPQKNRYLWLGLAALALFLAACLLAWTLKGQSSAVRAALAPTPDPAGRLMALQPELNRALSESRWEDAIAVLQVMRGLEPENQALVYQLAQLSYQLALRRRDQGDMAGALAALNEALALAPEDASLQTERGLLEVYQRGAAYHQAGDWEGVIRSLALLQREHPAYLDVTELLYSSYYNLGLAQQAAGDLRAARASFDSAVALLPDEPLAREKADEVAWLLRPPTPTPAPTPAPTPIPTPIPNRQRVVVDVSEQRMYVYEGEELIWKWVISTGEPGRDTAYGNFAIQSKIPMAYASTWNLDMPYWLGIYWSGPLENGIHALPVVRHTGYKLWDGFLGQRVSYGCVILSDENAETLYNWVKMGTPVVIQP